LPALPTGGLLDGEGGGIAVLDSGIDYRHQNFLGSDGNTRVRAGVDFVAIGRAASGDGWRKGQDFSPSTKESIDGAKALGLAKVLIREPLCTCDGKEDRLDAEDQSRNCGRNRVQSSQGEQDERYS
jgi:hypothetical protein